jgi:hypothetical protein
LQATTMISRSLFDQVTSGYITVRLNRIGRAWKNVARSIGGQKQRECGTGRKTQRHAA